MAIGQVTISAADWIAARVTDRMAIMAAASRIDEHNQQLGGNAAVAPAEDGGQAQLDQRRQQRSLLAAQESYRKVAARIKARLADRPQPQPLAADEATRPVTEHARLLDGMRDNPKLLATLIAADTTESGQAGQPRSTAHIEPVFARFDAEQATVFEARDAQDTGSAPDALDGGTDTAGAWSAWEAAEARADAVAADTVLRKGLWADLFEPVDQPTDHIPVVEG